MPLASKRLPRAGRPSTGKRKARLVPPTMAIHKAPSASPPNTADGGHRSSATNGQKVHAPLRSPSFAREGHAIFGLAAHSNDAPASDPSLGAAGQHKGARDGRVSAACSADLSNTLAIIRALYEQRRDLLGTAGGLTNRMKAIVKARLRLPLDTEVTGRMIKDCDYPPLKTLRAARAGLRAHIDRLQDGDSEGQGNGSFGLRAHAETLPGYRELWEPTNGLGALGLALIVGAAGNLADYSTHSQLWKRFGLHVYKGLACYKKRPGMSAADWQEAGYCPERRAIIYTIVNLGIATKDNAYHTLRDQYREQERRKQAAMGVTVLPAAKIPKDALPGAYMSEGHVLNRANRKVGKKLLRDLWKIWRREVRSAVSNDQANIASRAPSEPLPMAASG